MPIARVVCRAAAWAALAVLSVAAAAATATGCAPGGPAMRVTAMTFNIRYGTAPDGDNKWTNRQGQVFDLIRRQAADFVGVQEAVPFQVEALDRGLPEYRHVGRSREADPKQGEAVPILYRHDRWDLAASGTFWLSDTPEAPGSKSWGNNLPRVATWGRFVEKATGRPVYVFNTHFDHQSQPAREKSAVLLAARLRDIAAAGPQDGSPPPVLVMGDLNVAEANPAVRYLTGQEGATPVRLADTFRLVHPKATDVGTFHEFTGKAGADKIDYIFVRGGTKVLKAAILHNQRDGRYPSDHFPVMAEVAF